MEFSYDFLNLFERTAGLLDADPTLLCVSSWNDNSRASLGMDAQLLMRSSYFPGLGWMLKVRSQTVTHSHAHTQAHTVPLAYTPRGPHRRAPIFSICSRRGPC